jgi:DNA modification methylase
MTPYWTSADGRHTLYHGDCLAVMPTLGKVDAVVTDPPYGLSFMGKDWDHGVPGEHFWREALRVAKPGAHLLAFGGTRTYHRLAVAIEDAGWEIRDCLGWLYGSGFPKSMDAGKALDKAAGAEREVVATETRYDKRGGRQHAGAQQQPVDWNITAPATDAARQWDGWGTALKPAWEPVILARAPLPGTVAANLLAYGVGALNIGACRVGTDGGGTQCNNRDASGKCRGHKNAGQSTSGETFHGPDTAPGGRWPANIMHDGSAEVLAVFPDDAARFFYTAKASQEDRDEGLNGERQVAGGMAGRADGSMGSVTMRRNFHPTVKPTDLMRYLARLILPPGGLCLDPFCGSGSTGKAVIREGGRFVGIELDERYCEIAARRMEAELAQPMLIPPAETAAPEPTLF